MTASGRIPIVGLPEIRRGSLNLVTRPSTVAPAGMTVLPSTTTGCVRLPRNGSPTRLLKVASVVSSRTISAVPAGTGPLGGLVWATNIVPSRMQTSSSSHFFMEYLPRNPDVLLTLDPARGRNKRQSVHGEPAELRGQWQWPNGQFRSRKYLANNCVQ